MRNTLARLLQVAVVLVGAALLAFLLWEPRVEGRNVHATNVEIYFHDPFLAYVYVASTPVFLALYRAFRLAAYLGHGPACSPVTVAALGSIRRCALAVAGFAGLAMVFVVGFGDREDRPAGLFMCLLVVIASGSTAAAAFLLAGKVREALVRSGGGEG